MTHLDVLREPVPVFLAYDRGAPSIHFNKIRSRDGPFALTSQMAGIFWQDRRGEEVAPVRHPRNFRAGNCRDPGEYGKVFPFRVSFFRWLLTTARTDVELRGEKKCAYSPY